MKCNIREYARIGLVHHMLYPQCVEDPASHEATLGAFSRRTDIETFDCCVPYDAAIRRRLAPLLKGCGKEIVYASHLFPLRKISFCSTCPQEQGLIRLAMSDLIRVAGKAGASAVIFGSGSGGPRENHEAARSAFSSFCRWFCKELDRHGMSAMLEPFDTDVDKKFLMGPVRDCVSLVESLLPETANFGIELDIAHLPLMGENIEDAIRAAAPHLLRVHLGNCILKDKTSSFYGDMHPPVGFEGGEIDTPELTRVLRTLLDIGYLSKESRGALVLEIKPFPGRTPDESVTDNFQRLDKAWAMV